MPAELTQRSACLTCGHPVHRRWLAGMWGAWLHFICDPQRELHPVEHGR